MADAATYFGLAGEFREVPEEDTAGEVSGRDGAGDAVDGVGVVDRAVLSEGRQRASADGVEHHAAHLLPAALVQFVGSGGGRGNRVEQPQWTRTGSDSLHTVKTSLSQR